MLRKTAVFEPRCNLKMEPKEAALVGRLDETDVIDTRRRTVCICKTGQVFHGTGLELGQVTNEWQAWRLGNRHSLSHGEETI